MPKTALLVIDIQMGFAERDASGDARSCPEAEENIASLLKFFRQNSHPVIHIRHDSTDPNSVFHPTKSGNAVQEFAKEHVDEKVVRKAVNSAFIGTSLEADLYADGIERLVICGATANHCVETTTRMAGNLGFDVIYVSDAVWAYEGSSPSGTVYSADDVHQMSLANLSGEFANVLSTVDTIVWIC